MNAATRLSLRPHGPQVPPRPLRRDAVRPGDAVDLLRFAASFLWADLTLAEAEEVFLADLARELDVEDADAVLAPLLERPPAPDLVDPLRVRPELAPHVRDVALRAIAADGFVEDRELDLFDALDALLPGAPERDG